MRNTRKALTALQARARAGAAKVAHSRVVTSRTETPAAGDDSEDGAAPSASAELWLYGTVGGYWWGFDSDDVAAALRGLGDVDDILVRLHSFGGNAIEGIAVANLLANHPATVRIVVDGMAASAASMIALAGAELIMSPGSQLMVHDAWMWTAGNEAELRADADWIGKQSQNYAETYAHRASGTADSWRTIMRANDGDGTWYSAQETVDAGLADRVANIASTTPPPPMPDPVDPDDLELTAAAEWDTEVLLHPAGRAAWTTWRRSALERAVPSAPQPPNASAVGSTDTEGGTAVAFSDEQMTNLRATLGLPETADEAAIVAAVNAVVEDSMTDAPAPPAPAATTPPAGMSLVETAVLDELRAGAAAGREAQTTLRAQERDRTIDAAVRDGRITPARREHWATAYDADAEGTRTLLATLEPGLAVPVTEMGHAGAPESSQFTDAELDSLALELGLPKEALRG